MSAITTYRQNQETFAIYQQLKTAIVKAANPDIIFLLSTALQHNKYESIFGNASITTEQLHTTILLLLLPDLANKELHEWQDKIENHCSRILHITTIVLPTATFMEWTKTGHRFATTIWQYAPVLYDAGNIYKQIIIESKDSENEIKTLKQWQEGWCKAKEFLAGADLYCSRKQHKMAAFMMHQSAEQALHTLLEAGTGYHANTHSIDRLIRYASLAAHRLPEIFPRHTEQDRHLFSLLQKAYVETRYREGYIINDEELLTLSNKIKQVHEILEALLMAISTAPSSPQQQSLVLEKEII